MFFQDYRTIQAGIDLGKSVVPPLAESRIGSEVRPAYSGFYSGP